MDAECTAYLSVSPNPAGLSYFVNSQMSSWPPSPRGIKRMKGVSEAKKGLRAEQELAGD